MAFSGEQVHEPQHDADRTRCEVEESGRLVVGEAGLSGTDAGDARGAEDLVDRGGIRPGGVGQGCHHTGIDHLLCALRVPVGVVLAVALDELEGPAVHTAAAVEGLDRSLEASGLGHQGQARFDLDGHDLAYQDRLAGRLVGRLGGRRRRVVPTAAFVVAAAGTGHQHDGDEQGEQPQVSFSHRPSPLSPDAQEGRGDTATAPGWQPLQIGPVPPRSALSMT